MSIHHAMTVEERIAQIQKPGNGFGHGCTVVSRKEGETAGVQWTRIIVTDNWNGERESIYMTESGWQVEQSTGTYGDPTRWSYSRPGSAHTLAFAVNLTEAFTAIARNLAK